MDSFPLSLQEMILAKLRVEDLLRCRATCKVWRRITSTSSFRRRYGPNMFCSRPWFLFFHSRTGFITANDVTGKPRGFLHDPWIPTSTNTSIVSTSHGLLLLLSRGKNRALFTVVNPVTKLTKELPVLELTSDQDIVYSQQFDSTSSPDILCTRGDSSYKVFTLGLMNGDKLTGLLYKINFVQNSGTEVPEDISEYKRPFMLVYSSISSSWSSPITTGFPLGFMLPFQFFSKAHQSFISPERIIHCVTNSGYSRPERIARFNTETLEWNPVLLPIPSNLQLQCFMVDHQGNLMLVVGDKETMKFFWATISEKDEVVIGEEIEVPARIRPENRLMFGLMDVWGWFRALLVHVPVIQKQQGPMLSNRGVGHNEPRVHRWFHLLGSDYYCDWSFGVPLLVGAYITGSVELLKLMFAPSIRLPD